MIREVGELKLAQSKSEGERQRLSDACAELRNEKARLEAAKDELSRQHRHVCDDVRKMEALLEQSEGERLELRTKYISVGEKVEELLQTEARESSAAIAQLQQQVEALKSRLGEANKALKDRGRAARAAVRERDAQIKVGLVLLSLSLSLSCFSLSLSLSLSHVLLSLFLVSSSKMNKQIINQPTIHPLIPIQ